MRNIKTFEKLGVPDNIFEVSELLYDKIIDCLKRGDYMRDNDKNYIKFLLSFSLKEKIADLKLDNFDIIINTDIVDISKVIDNAYKKGDLIFTGMSISNRSDKEVLKNRSINRREQDTKIRINLISIDEKPAQSDVIEFLTKEKNEVISSLSHELKHKYDDFKNVIEPVKQSIEYEAYGDPAIGLSAVKKFCHYLYYTTTVEGLVRASEVHSNMKLDDVTKEGFLDFLKNNKTYKRLKEINSYSIEEFKNDLRNDIDNVTEVLDFNDIEYKSDDDKVNIIMELTYKTLCDSQINSYKDFLAESGFERMFGFSDETKIKMFRKMFNNITRYRNNYINYFEDTIKMFKFVSDKVIKKISKLYDMSKDTNTSREYELYNKISNKNKKLETKIVNFEDFLYEGKSTPIYTVKEKLKKLLLDTKWFKGNVDERVEQLVKIQKKYIELNCERLSTDEIADSLFKYEKNLKLK